MAVREEHNGLAVDQGIVNGQGADGLRDPWKPVVEQGAASAPYVNALALLSGEDPEAVMLHLVQPAWPGGRGGDEGRAAGEDEIGRRVAPGDTPQHACM